MYRYQKILHTSATEDQFPRFHGRSKARQIALQ
jgi:hypothetical protein